MADANAIRLPAAEWVGPAWEGAPDGLRRRYLEYVAGLARAAKLRELRRGVGVDGDRLRRVKRSSRPDGATGPPLSPHRAASRAQKWIRASVGTGHVTLWWSHGWGQILGYHRAGSARLPVRNVIGLTDPDMVRLRAEARRYWRSLAGPASPRPVRVVDTRRDRFVPIVAGDYRTRWS